MADYIEVVFATDDLRTIDFRDEDRFAFGVRSGEEIAERINNAASASADDRVGIVAEGRVVVGGKIAAAVELVAGEDEAASFNGDVAHGGDPGIAGVGGGGAVDFDALGVHRGTHQREIIFPADDGAQLSEFSVVDGERGTVAESPHQALRACRHDLAMFAEEGAIGRKEKDGAVERSGVAFDDADDEMNVVGAGGAAELIDGGAGNVDTAFPIAAEIFAASVGASADYCAEIEPAGVGGDEGFRKEDDLRTLVRSIFRKRGEFVERAFAVEDNGSGLDDRDFEGSGVIHFAPFAAEETL